MCSSRFVKEPERRTQGGGGGGGGRKEEVKEEFGGHSPEPSVINRTRPSGPQWQYRGAWCQWQDPSCHRTAPRYQVPDLSFVWCL